MTDVTSSRYGGALPNGLSQVVLISGTTVTGGTDTLTCDLSDYGITELLSVRTVVHTTDGSVIVEESATTAVSDGELTVTTASGNDNKRRVVEVLGIGKAI